MAKAIEIRSKHPDEARNCVVSFEHILEDDETLTGTPTVSFSPSGLTVSSERVNTVALTIENDEVAIGKAVQFKLSGGAAGITYTGKVQTSGTSATPSQTPLVVVKLLVTNAG